MPQSELHGRVKIDHITQHSKFRNNIVLNKQKVGKQHLLFIRFSKFTFLENK